MIARKPDADSERCSVEYNPPPDLLEVIDSWAATLLKDSGIELKENCSLCSTWKLHATRAKISREEYRWDVQRNEKNSGAIYLACDMEKVIMCPRFPGMKRVIFTRRIVLFHEAFAHLGGGEKKPIGIIWHEGITGRCDEDLASTYAEIINHVDYRDYQHFIFWVDNCAAQNKLDLV